MTSIKNNLLFHRVSKIITCFIPILLGLIAFPDTMVAQEKTGITMSNFAGINSVYLNPSLTSNTKLYADLNVFSGGMFLDNNFVYIHKEDYHLFDFFKKNPSLPGIDEKGKGVDYNTDGKPVRGLVQAEILGPGFSMSVGKHTFGLTSKVSAITSVSDFPYEMAVLMFEGLDYDSLVGVNITNDAFEVPAMMWWELGAHYSQVFRKSNRNVWSFGFNIRNLFALAGGHATGKGLDYTLENDLLMYYDTNNNLITRTIHNLDIRNLDAQVAFSIPFNYDSLFYPTIRSDFKGNGIAGDIGITFRKNREPSDNFRYRRPCENKYEDYIYKIGLSLINFGKIKFKKNVENHQYNDVSVYWRNVGDLTYENINQVTREISYELTGDSLASEVGGNFAVGLPAAFSFQGDYQYFPNWYLGGALILPLRISEIQLKRSSQAFLSLRYESPSFEFGVPVSLYDFHDPRIGLYARFYYFTIGTDKLGSYFGFDDFYGLDFYFAFKIHIMKGVCALKRPSQDCRHLTF